MTYDSQTTGNVYRQQCAPPLLRLVAKLGLAVLIGLLLYRWDVSLIRTRYVLIHPGEAPAQQIISGVREFGQPVCVVVVLIVVASYDRRRRRIVGLILLAEVIAWVGYQPAKMLVARYRPIAIVEFQAGLRPDPAETPRSALGLWPRGPGGEGAPARPEPADPSTETLSSGEILADLRPADTWLGWRPGNASLMTQSFPSGHAAGAFALAIVLAYFYPRLAWMLWVLAVGCTLTRYVDAMHWPSDCWVGAVIGYVAARIALRLGGRPSTPRASG